MPTNFGRPSSIIKPVTASPQTLPVLPPLNRLFRITASTVEPSPMTALVHRVPYSVSSSFCFPALPARNAISTLTRAYAQDTP